MLAAHQRIRLGAALDFDFVCMARASSNYLFLRDSAQRLGKTVRARLHGHSFDAVLALVAAGVGIALVPSSVLGGRWQANPLAIIELDELWALRRLSLLVRKDARLPGFITEFVSFLLDDPQVAVTRASG